jgi:hypothetical protein
MPLPAGLLTTTCSIHRNNPPDVTPASTNVPCQLVPDYAAAARNLHSTAKPWTHYLVLASSVDIRDGYAGSTNLWNYAQADTVYVPSGGTTAYVVVFVEVRGKGTPGEHKRVYLDRQAPSWPTV